MQGRTSCSERAPQTQELGTPQTFLCGGFEIISSGYFSRSILTFRLQFPYELVARLVPTNPSFGVGACLRSLFAGSFSVPPDRIYTGARASVQVCHTLRGWLRSVWRPFLLGSEGHSGRSTACGVLCKQDAPAAKSALPRLHAAVDVAGCWRGRRRRRLPLRSSSSAS